MSCAGGAQAQGLPAIGPDVRVGDLRTEFQQAFGGLPPAQAHSWTYQPSIDLSETFDDGVVLPSGRTGSDFITMVTPGITIIGDSARLTGTIYYTPTLNIYAMHGDLNSIAQNLNAEVTATVIPDLFFVDLRGYATQESLNGGTGPATGVATTGDDQAQTTSLSVTPRLQHRFGGTGTGILSDTLTRNMISTVNNNTAANADLTGGNFTSNQENASFTTGEDFGRISDTLSAVALQYSGTGTLQGAHRETFSDSASYAFNRFIAVTGSVGHENIVYGFGGPAPIDDITWSGGVQLTPGPNTSINLSYGHQQGSDSASLDSSFAPTARTRVYARYSQSVGTQQEQFQVGLAQAAIGPGNILVDRITGAPLLIGNNFLAVQSSEVFRTTTASLTGALIYDRDTITVDIEHDDEDQISAVTPGTGSSSGIFGSVAWSHDVSDATVINSFVQYGTRTIAGSGNQADFTFNVSISYIISPSLTASAQYTRTQTTGAEAGTADTPASRDIAVVSLHKTF